MESSKLDKLKRLRTIRREGAERRLSIASQQSFRARQKHKDAEANAVHVEQSADGERKAYLRSLFTGKNKDTASQHSMAVAAYLRTGQDIAQAYKRAGALDNEAFEAEAITQTKRQEVLKKRNDERKLDALIDKIKRDELRHKS